MRPTRPLFLGTLLLLPALAFAQPSQNTLVAEALFDEGQKLMSAGKFNEACEKFAASQKLDPATGTLLNLAACHEKLNKTATAWAEFNEAYAQASRAGDKARQQFARQHIDTLEKLLFRVTINVLKPNKNLVVKLDGNELVKEGLGVAIPTDPGQHEVEATQPGRKPFRQTLNGQPGGSEKVEIPELPEVEYGMPHPDTPPETPPPVLETPKEQPKGGTSPLLYAGIGALGAGVAGVVVGAIFGITAMGQASDRDKLCPPKMPCRNQQAFDLDYDARVSQTMMFVIGGAGAALAITGGVLLGLSFGGKKPAQSGLVIAPTIGGLQLGGSF